MVRVCGSRDCPRAPLNTVNPSGKFSVITWATKSDHSASLTGARPGMLRPKNSSATSIGFCAGSRQALGGTVSTGAAQPATSTSSTADMVWRIAVRGERPLFPRRRGRRGLDPGAQNFVFGDLAERVELRVGQNVGRGLGVAERMNTMPGAIALSLRAFNSIVPRRV